MKACLCSAAGLLLALAAPAFAQSSGCPALPAGSALHWEQTGTDTLLICKALDDQGNQAFGVMLTAEPSMDPKRHNREEKGVIDGKEMRWYRTEIANRPDAQTRVAVVELDKDRYAQIWIDADSPAALQASMTTAERLDFRRAGTPVASSP